ncbi:MAG: cytochrome P450 [Ilumatobacter sp.]
MRFPSYDIDLFDDDVIREPYSHYRAMRDLGPFVWLPRHEIIAAVRFDTVRDVLKQPDVFISSEGVAVNAALNRRNRTNTLISDGDLHRQLKSVVGRPITPPNIDELTVTVRSMADELVSRLVGHGDFDGIADFAQQLPIEIVSHMVGIPEEGRERMLAWSAALFNVIGAPNERAEIDGPVAAEMGPFIETIDYSDLRPGSWGAQLFEAVDRGEVEEKYLRGMLVDYIGPALDTTLNGIAHMVHLLGTHPEQWALVLEDPDNNINRAVEETLRYETVIRGFTRLATEDIEVSGERINAGERVWAVLSSANRDERRFDDPDEFSVLRPRNNHVGFGSGQHLCVGVHLARLEMRSLLEAMTQHVTSIRIDEARRGLNNMLRTFETLSIRFD